MRPADLGRQLSEDLDALAAAAGSAEKAPEEVQKKVSEDIQKHLRSIQDVFNEVATQETTAEDATMLLGVLLSGDILSRLVSNLGLLDFEVRKDVTGAFSMLLRIEKPENATSRVVDHVARHTQLLRMLVDGYSDPGIALHCGIMLGSCARHADLVAALLNSGCAKELFRWTQSSNFDVAADAFGNLRDLLMKHPGVAAQWVQPNFEQFFESYNCLLRSEDYVTLRQSLKLLSEILLSRDYLPVMLRYVNDAKFLQIHMNLLKDKSKAIQFEAFHIFKIFAANPQKSQNVHKILYQNKDKLVKYLEGFHTDRTDDDQFVQDRKTVVDRLRALEAPPTA